VSFFFFHFFSKKIIHFLLNFYSRQLQVLMEHDRYHNENIPLVQVRDILKNIPQLQFMARNPEAPPAKRTRTS